MKNNKNAEVSDRGRHIPKSAIRKLIPLSRETEKKGIKVIKLNIGQPDIETPAEFWEGVRNFKEKVLAYSPSEGRPEYLKALVEYYKRFDINLSEGDIVVTTGGIEGILYTIMAATDPGDEIVIAEPYYSNYIGMAFMAQVLFVPFTTYAENGYHLPPRETIEKAITPKTRAVLFASPGNPTGCVYTREEMELLGSIGKDHGLFLLSDEVYRELVYEGESFATSILHIAGMEENGVIIDSVSKRFSACGARIGCIASKNREFMEAIRALATVRLSAPTLDQIGIANCINTPPEYLETVKREYIERRDVVCDALARVDDVVCHKPGGALYAMAKLTGIDTEDFAKWLLTDFNVNNETVLVSPGAGFYATEELGRDEIRIAFILNADTMKRAMNILCQGIQEYRKQAS